jgi:hypothetical protein
MLRPLTAHRILLDEDADPAARDQVTGGSLAGRLRFNRPRARSEAMMGYCGRQPAVLGLTLNKLVNELADRRGIVLAPC